MTKGKVLEFINTNKKKVLKGAVIFVAGVGATLLTLKVLTPKDDETEEPTLDLTYSDDNNDLEEESDVDDIEL